MERRFLNVFGEIASEQRYADDTEKAGDSVTAAAIRTRFQRMSGFTAQEAQAIKELGERYHIDSQAQHDKEIATVIAVRKANPGVHMSRLNSPEIAEVQQERGLLWNKLKTDLIQALGSRGFTKLDSYSRHIYDNAKVLTLSKGSPSDQSAPSTHQQP
jgi:hypothetical protein